MKLRIDDWFSHKKLGRLKFLGWLDGKALFHGYSVSFGKLQDDGLISLEPEVVREGLRTKAIKRDKCI